MNDQNTTPTPDEDDRFAPPGGDLSSIPDDTETPATFDLDNLAAEMEAFAGELDAPADLDDDDEGDTLSDDEDFAADNAPVIEADAVRITPADDIDVDLALAAVSGLDEMIEQREAEARAEEERLETEREAELERERELAAEDARLDDMLNNPLPMPGALALQRGSIASLVPGLVLVGVGIWLTVAYTTDSAPPPLTVMAILLGVFGIALLSTWLGSGRWNRGALFFALWGALSAGAGWYALTRVGEYALVPALIAALGVTFILSAVLARPVKPSFAVPGFVLLVIAGVMVVFSLNLIPPVVVNTLSAGWIVVAVISGVILLLPLLRRLRG